MGQYSPPPGAARADLPCAVGAPGRPVDLVHLARQTMGDDALEREVLQIFIAQTQVCLRRLKEASDARTWKQTAHSIKGSARGVGAWSVAEHAGSAERMRFEPEADTCRLAILALESEVEQAARYIRSLFTDH